MPPEVQVTAALLVVRPVPVVTPMKLRPAAVPAVIVSAWVPAVAPAADTVMVAVPASSSP